MTVSPSFISKKLPVVDCTNIIVIAAFLVGDTCGYFPRPVELRQGELCLLFVTRESLGPIKEAAEMARN